MKVTHIFNMANNGYQLCRALRLNGVDAHLVINAKEFAMSHPFWEYLSLHYDPYNVPIRVIEKYFKTLPEWCHVWSPKGMHMSPSTIMKLLRVGSNSDLFHLHPPSQVYFQFLRRKPFVIHEAGWIRTFPYGHKKGEKLARRAYKAADCIVMTNPDTYEILAQIPYKRQWFVPFVIDVDKYKPAKKKHDKTVFLHPARQHWSVKGNDLLILAFKLYLESTGDKDAVLKLAHWGLQEDINNAKCMIKRHRLEKQIEWFEPLSKPDLIKEIQQSTAVCDQYLLGSSGTAGFEAMSCDKPVIMYLNEFWNRHAFDRDMPLVLNGNSVSDIAANMIKARTFKGHPRKFILKHMAPKQVGAKMKKAYEEILNA
ncbi:MAG: glycosyltransferase [Thermodesulfovibrionia bacterium]|nr:glycosyltransferase [Thermodesulfovibrionia bacterium]